MLLATQEKKLNIAVATKASKPSKWQRHIPLAMRREVFKSANYQCEYKNCDEKHFLELDHIREIKNGGKGTIINLRVLSRTHNQLRIK